MRRNTHDILWCENSYRIFFLDSFGWIYLLSINIQNFILFSTRYQLSITDIDELAEKLVKLPNYLNFKFVILKKLLRLDFSQIVCLFSYKYGC